MGEGAGVKGRTRRGLLAGGCEDGDGGAGGVAGSGELEGMEDGELDKGCVGRGGDTAGVATG